MPRLVRFSCEMEGKQMTRGTQIRVLAYGGKVLLRRVWDDADQGVMICSEEEYQRALATRDEPLCSGFPKRDIIEVLGVGTTEEVNQNA
ncbi:MAG TPA: hypothetical protein VKR83_13060 [Ktedonobacteraceae bacterium]|nr:hypothetical protein [Ktedonobacteraceae bacterium]